MSIRWSAGARVAVLAAVAVSLVAGGSARAGLTGVETNDPELPPTVGEYVAQVGPEFDAGAFGVVMMTDLAWDNFTSIFRTPVGDDEHQDFNSVLTGDAIGLGPFTLTGPVTTVVTDRLLSTTGTFATEIVSMSLTGNIGGQPVELRESPTETSPGSTTITDLGGGLYHIDSFFDVFTELSVDGGGSWVASVDAVRMTLVPTTSGEPPIPEPGSLSLLGLAALALRPRRRR